MYMVSVCLLMLLTCASMELASSIIYYILIKINFLNCDCGFVAILDIARNYMLTNVADTATIAVAMQFQKL